LRHDNDASLIWNCVAGIVNKCWKLFFYKEGTLYWSSCSNGQNYIPRLLLHSTFWFVLLEIRHIKTKNSVCYLPSAFTPLKANSCVRNM